MGPKASSSKFLNGLPPMVALGSHGTVASGCRPSRTSALGRHHLEARPGRVATVDRPVEGLVEGPGGHRPHLARGRVDGDDGRRIVDPGQGLVGRHLHLLVEGDHQRLGRRPRELGEDGDGCPRPVHQADLGRRDPRQLPLVGRLEARHPHLEALDVGRAELGQALGGDLAHPAEEMGGEVVRRRHPAGVLPEEDARHRLQHRPGGGEAVARQLSDGDELLGRPFKGGRHRLRVRAQLPGEDGLDLGQVLDATGRQADDHRVGRRHQGRSAGAHDRGPGRPGDADREVPVGPQVGVEGGVVPSHPPRLVRRLHQAQVPVVGRGGRGRRPPCRRGTWPAARRPRARR